MPQIPPWPYALVLASAVGLGLPAGALVVGAGALFGPGIGLLTVLFGEALGLALNWRLCRGWLRPRAHAAAALRPGFADAGVALQPAGGRRPEEAAGGSLGPAALALRGGPLLATAAVLVLLSRGLRR